MHYLITGGSGFVGRHLTAALLLAGHGVTYTGRSHSRKMDSRASFYDWDGHSLPPLDAMPRLDGIFHLIGEPVAQRWTPEVKNRIRSSRIDSTRLLVEALSKLQHRPPVLVSASAIGYYGDRGDQVLTESAPPGSGFLADTCREWESAAAGASALGVRVVSARISVVLGLEGGALPPLLSLFRLGLGGPLAGGKPWMSWIHIQDLVQLLLFAARTPSVSGPVNASSPEPVTNQQFTRALGSFLHRPAVLPVPLFALKLAMGEVAQSIVESARVVPERAQESGFRFGYGELAGALKDVLH